MIIRKKFLRLVKTVCLMAAILIFASSFVPCFAAAVKVPVFTQVPEKKTLIAGTGSFVQATAEVFGGADTDIKYSLEVLRGTYFYSTGEFFVRKSGSIASVKVETGKGSALLLNYGTYSARVRAATLDETGKEIAVGYCPVFEIEVLPPVFRAVSAQARVSYGESFSVTAQINEYYAESENVSYSWEVNDGGVSRAVSEGESINGVVFTDTNTPVLHAEGTPEKIFTLSFSATVLVNGASKPAVSESASVEFRPELITGFSLGASGMKFFRVDGQYATGWLKYNGSLYYFDPDSGIMETKSRVIDGKRCYFSFDGRLLRGFMRTPLGLRYYENGEMLFGWHTVDGTEYYFEPYIGYMTAKVDAESGKIIYFSDYGCRR